MVTNTYFDLLPGTLLPSSYGQLIASLNKLKVKDLSYFRERLASVILAERNRAKIDAAIDSFRKLEEEKVLDFNIISILNSLYSREDLSSTQRCNIYTTLCLFKTWMIYQGGWKKMLKLHQALLDEFLTQTDINVFLDDSSIPLSLRWELAHAAYGCECKTIKPEFLKEVFGAEEVSTSSRLKALTLLAHQHPAEITFEMLNVAKELCAWSYDYMLVAECFISSLSLSDDEASLKLKLAEILNGRTHDRAIEIPDILLAAKIISSHVDINDKHQKTINLLEALMLGRSDLSKRLRIIREGLLAGPFMFKVKGYILTSNLVSPSLRAGVTPQNVPMVELAHEFLQGISVPGNNDPLKAYYDQLIQPYLSSANSILRDYAADICTLGLR